MMWDMARNLTHLAILEPDGAGDGGQIEWKSYVWAPVGQGPMREASGTRVATLAQRMIALERAKAQRGKPDGLPFYHQKRYQPQT